MRARNTVPLGTDFSKLWTASAISSIGDGVTLVAGPLLVASLTANPAAVAGAAFVQQLPWLLFVLVSGVFVDRLERRRLIVTVNVLRAAALGALVAATAAGIVTVPVVYVVFFLLGVGETLADSASAAFLPAIVAAERLGDANARLMATFTIGNQFLAKPLGAWLFVLGAAVPFALDAVSFCAAAALVATVRAASKPAISTANISVREDIASGLRWLWRHRLLRTLALSMGVGNVAFCAAFATFVLYAHERLGVSGVGYGLLLTASAVGGLLGTLAAGRLRSWLGAATLLRAGLGVEAATHLALAVVRSPWAAAMILVMFGIHTMVWGVIVVTTRQRQVPDHLLGRVGSVYSLFDLGGAALGSLLGGGIAQALGVVAPFWIAAAIMTCVAVLAWRPLGRAVAV
ncbi:MFS transporter [Nocardia mexicana]|uniref:Putative MFS family arabinose efflux permease n=1 Tax=Nocardia mexicana TaxID=279262 RepID=A0A370GHF0_9NOCA|nr:MFS transporter [Nocardia mexicana]RDI42780.1 putative MFS family arabinose efflux permease [Nocardia mexicana]